MSHWLSMVSETLPGAPLAQPKSLGETVALENMRGLDFLVPYRRTGLELKR